MKKLAFPIVILLLAALIVGLYALNNRSEQVEILDSTQTQTTPPPELSTTTSTEDERALLPSVTEVETWTQFSESISEEQNFAPGIIPLHEGGYRIYWNDYDLGGITSAVSEDGINFELEEGTRIGLLEDNTDCFASHPWFIQTDNGYRAYYNGVCDSDQSKNIFGVFKIFSAISEQGLDFTSESVVVDFGEENGLTHAGHGRIIQLEDGTYRLFFSANFIGIDAPADILGASSTDGIEWELDESPILIMGHDPAIVYLDGVYHMFSSFLSKNMLHLTSIDGYNFEIESWVEFYDSEGNIFEAFGDVEALVLSNGDLVIYGAGKLEGEEKGYPGLIIMKKE